MPRRLAGALSVLLLLSALAAGGDAGRPAVIDLLLPAGATATADGQEVGGRTLTVDGVPPGGTRRVKLVVKFADGTEDERVVDIAAGQRVPVPVPHPGPDKPSIVATQTLTPINAAALSRDGRYVAVGLESKAAVLWDAHAGRPVRTFAGHQKAVTAVAFRPDARHLLTGSADGTAVLWDTLTGDQLRTLRGHAGPVTAVAFSPDGSRVLTGSADATAVLWDARTGEVVHTLKGHRREVLAVAYAPDGQTVATASADLTVALWGAGTGQQTVVLKGHREEVSCVAFSPDGGRVATATWENLGFVWEAATGRRLATSASKHSGDVYSVAFTADGRRYLTGDRDEGLMMWDAATGEKVRTFAGHSADVASLAVSGDGRVLLSGSRDGTAKLWDLATGRELLSLTTDAARAGWAAVAPDGLFDASEPGRRMVGFRFSKRPGGELDQFFHGSYRPGLLAEIVRGERPVPAKPLGASRPPLVKLVAPKSRLLDTPEATLVVDVTDQGGVVSGLAVEVNGVPVQVAADAQAKRVAFTVPLAPGANRVRVRAAGGDGTWESVPAEVELTYPGVAERRGRLYVVAVGVGRPAEASLALKYPAADAQALADLLRARAGTLYDRVDIIPLLDRDATKAAVEDAVRDVAELTRPQDTFAVLLCGPGALLCDRVYVAPHDLRLAGDRPDAALRARGLAVDDLAAALGTARARKRVLVVDAASSGTAFPVAPGERLAFGLRATAERLSRAHGVFLVAAAPATAAAVERPELGRGALTHALLNSVNGSGDVAEWFRAAAAQATASLTKLTGDPQCVESSTQAKGFALFGSDR